MKNVIISDDGFLNLLMCQPGIVEEVDRELIKCLAAAEDNGGVSEMTIKIQMKQNATMNSVIDTVADWTSKRAKCKRAVRSLFKSIGGGIVDQPQEQDSLELGSPVQSEKSTLTIVGKINEQ